MNLEIDLNNALLFQNGSFDLKLFQLILKADRLNIEKLSKVFPKHVAMVEHYKKTGEITEDII